MSFLSGLFGRKRPDRLLDARGYAEQYAAAVRRAHPGTHVAVHTGPTAAQTRVEWRTPSGWDSRQFFGNFHARYLQDPGELESLFAAQLAEAEAVGAAPSPVDWRGALRPVLKTLAWQHAVAAQLAAGGRDDPPPPFVVRPLVADLVVACVVDTAESMAFVNTRDLATHGLDEAELHATALANLASQLPELRIEGGHGRFAARLDRNYDASMVLLLDRWRDRVGIEGDLVLALPARDELLMCPAGDAALVDSLALMAATIAAQSAYALTNRLLTWRGGRLGERDSG